MQTCQGKTRTGAACRAHASAGGLCFFHANPDRARTLGQVGGRKNRRVEVDLQIPDNATTADRTLTLQAIRLLFSGDMHAREAGALVQLCNFLHRVIPTADLEARVAMLEEQLAQEEIETSSDPDSTGAPADGPEPGQIDVPLEGEEQQEPPTFDVTADSQDAGAGSGNGSGEAEEA